MENKLLQPLLQAGLIDIGDNDERLVNIEQSIADVQKKLENDYSLLPSYTLVALDPGISPSEQILEDTESVIASHWKALRGKFTERPTAIIRAVILHALYNLGSEDVQIARIIYLTASNFFPYSKLGREREIVVRVITELGNLSEEDATAEWSLADETPDLKVASLKISGLKFGAVAVDTAKLKAKLVEASNRSSGYNPYQHPEQWAEHFGTHAADGITEAMKTTLSGLTKALDTTVIENSINSYFTDFKKSLKETLKSSFNITRAVERRSKLLWWKETLYSSSLKNSYRVLNHNVQPVVMAVDLYNQLPAITPASVDFLLRDTLLLLNPEANKKFPFARFLTNLSNAENRAILKDFIHVGKENGRITITDFFALIVHEKASLNAFKQYTGVDDSETVSLEDIAVIVLHDLLATYLITE